ncbi:MAG: site-2 protease family protein [Clostridia bacterium]|nr:site-2 protease family protein [Clostridia bacterium]
MFANFNITELLQNFIVMFTAISVHEFAHGVTAYKLGDPTAKNAGRLTLNPLAHLDPIGALCMVVFRFGWARPVPVNMMYFRNRKRDMAIVAFAGPVANILMALLFMALYAPIHVFLPGNAVKEFIAGLLSAGVSLNLCFAVFNLIPFPPLDGSKILNAVLPYNAWVTLLQYERYGFILLIVLSFSGILGRILNVLVSPLFDMCNAFLRFLISVLGG